MGEEGQETIVYVVTSEFYPEGSDEASTVVERVFFDKDEADAFAKKRETKNTFYYVTPFPVE